MSKAMPTNTDCGVSGLPTVTPELLVDGLGDGVCCVVVSVISPVLYQMWAISRNQEIIWNLSKK